MQLLEHIYWINTDDGTALLSPLFFLVKAGCELLPVKWISHSVTLNIACRRAIRMMQWNRRRLICSVLRFDWIFNFNLLQKYLSVSTTISFCQYPIFELFWTNPIKRSKPTMIHSSFLTPDEKRVHSVLCFYHLLNSIKWEEISLKER